MFSMLPRGRLLLTFLWVAGSATSVVATDDPTGVWKLQISLGSRGSRTSILNLQRRGDAVAGHLLRYQGARSTIENGRFLNGELSFEVSRERDGRKFVSLYTGRFVNETLEGTTQFDFRGRQRTWDWVATRTTAGPTTPTDAAPPVAADIDLTAENYQAWRDHILPDSSELAWEQIPWLTTFQDGILAAAAADKPLLLWTMNGHPLGCT